MGKRVGSGREAWHGTPNGYSNRGCRCAGCTAANTEAHADWVAKTKEPPPGTSDLNRYKYYGARDPAATAANAERRAAQYARQKSTR